MNQKDELTSLNISSLTEDQHNLKAHKLDQNASNSIFNLFYSLREINNNEYYKRLGFSSMADYCKQKFDYTKSIISEYLKIAHKLLPQSDSLDVDNVTNTEFNSSFFDNYDGHSLNLKRFCGAELFSLPIRKLMIISKLSEQQILELNTEGKTHIRGKIYTIDMINQTDRDILYRLITNTKAKQIKPNNNPDKLPFAKVYSNTEKYIGKILIDLSKCDLVLFEHKKQIDALIDEIIKIYDSYIPKSVK
jgi:hypothetical protein